MVAKFAEVARLTIVVIPATLLLLRVVNRYYANLNRQLLSGDQRRLGLREHAAPLVVIPIGRWDRISQRAIAYACRLSSDVTALHCTDLDGPDAEEQESRMKGEWGRYVEQPAREAGLSPPRLLVVPSPYRSVLGPLLRTIEELNRDHPGKAGRDRAAAFGRSMLMGAAAAHGATPQRWGEHRRRRRAVAAPKPEQVLAGNQVER